MATHHFPNAHRCRRDCAIRWNGGDLPTLAEVLDRVVSDGPQIITHGGGRFVVLAAQEFTTPPKRPGLVDALLNGPRFDGVDIEREPWDMREVEL